MDSAGCNEEIHHFDRYEHLAREGDTQDKVLRLEAGWAARYRVVAGGARQITSLFLPGDFCEPQWMLTGKSELPVIALTPIRAVKIPLTTIHAPPGDGVRRLLAGLVDVLNRQTELIIDLGRKSAKDRVRDFLVEIYHRLVRAGHASDDRCRIPITQQDIGDLLGLSAVHVNRVLRDLREDGAVYLSGKTLIIAKTLRSTAPDLGRNRHAAANRLLPRQAWGRETSRASEDGSRGAAQWAATD